MASENKKLKASNLSVLANASELASDVIMDVAGNDASSTVDGELITKAFVADAAMARLQYTFSPKLKD